MNAFVYVLRSKRSGRYYVGSTDHLIRRYWQHANGYDHTTKRMLPVIVEGWIEFESLAAAREAERKLKAKKSRVHIERFLKEAKRPM